MITIRDGQSVVELAPKSCGAVTRFAWETADGAIEWLRPSTSDAIDRAFPQGMACFPLVPFSNRIRDGRFTFEGREIQLSPNFPPEPHAIHGQGWHASWDVVSNDEAAATLEYVHGADEWPFPYRARQTFRLENDALAMEMRVTNEGDARMPLGFGFHVYFPRTPGARLHTSATKMWEVDDRAMPARLVDPPKLDPLDPNSIVLDDNFLGWSGDAKIEWPEWNGVLEMNADDHFKCVVVYTPEGEGYFCVEPVTNCIDAFNLAAEGRDDTGMLVLDPGAEIAGTVRLAPRVEA